MTYTPSKFPAGSGTTPLWQSVGFTVSTDTTSQVATITPPRANGVYWVVMRGQCDDGDDFGNMLYSITIDGVGTVDSGRADAGGTQSLTATVGLFYGPTTLTPSNVVRFFANKDTGTFTGTLYLLFVPTPTYPQ